MTREASLPSKVRRTIHPFPARMAPELAIQELDRERRKLRVLDPMAGSGTVVREAIRHGHRAVGFDCDPLAVLMAKVWTTPIDDDLVKRALEDVLYLADSTNEVHLPWIDDDEETEAFTHYWFAAKQRNALRRLSYSLSVTTHRRRAPYRAAIDLLRLGLSRIIVTKNVGASLARDVSHSRPHRVSNDSTYDIFAGFESAVARIRLALSEDPPKKGARIDLADARSLPLKRASVDLVITSPPYLNAIDYIRGHRLALVWLGYDMATLRGIRSDAIGTERGLDISSVNQHLEDIAVAIGTENVSDRHSNMIKRYAADLYKLMYEIRRVLRPEGRAVIVVGNSTLRGQFIRNSEGVKLAAKKVGMSCESEATRKLPDSRRYLPLAKTDDVSLGKRMRTEHVLRFAAA